MSDTLTAEIKLIGLTGPMAAGKNAAADILREKGFVILDADVMAHGVLDAIKDRIIHLFSEDARRLDLELTDSRENLNRKNLGRIVFQNPEKLSLLESLVHPAVNAEAEKHITENPGQSFVINAALLHKMPLIKQCNLILYIDAPALIRLIRVRKRDKLAFKHIAERFSAQKEIFTKCKNRNADIYRVGNSGTKKRLKKKIEAVLRVYTKKG
ncbi:dephospho-CoA kinase [Treponema sp. HNW]|uniref:dephospho-CoA kinase n=1 Tax=Treponema sp. HNW TaxID=3116654 RepID=UPI003D0F2F47